MTTKETVPQALGLEASRVDYIGSVIMDAMRRCPTITEAMGELCAKLKGNELTFALYSMGRLEEMAGKVPWRASGVITPLVRFMISGACVFVIGACVVLLFNNL